MDAEGYRRVGLELRDLVEAHVHRLGSLADTAASRPRAPGKWSPKQTLGHLLDSAANNHQRFVRMQLQRHAMLEGYGADEWVRIGGYCESSWGALVAFWAAYNRFLAHLILRIDPAADANTWSAPAGEPSQLGDVVEDYVRHLRHHLAQIAVP